MNGNIILLIPALICIITASIVFITVSRQTNMTNYENTVSSNKHTKSKKVIIPIAYVICINCIFIQGFMIGHTFNLQSTIDKSQTKPISLFHISKKVELPEKINAISVSLKTTADGTFSLDQSKIIVPGNNIITLNSIVEGLEDFCVDFTQNATWITVNNREYIFINREVTTVSQKIEPSLWKDEENGIVKLYSAIPLSDTQELMIYTDVSEVAEDNTAIAEISSYINNLTDDISIANEFILNINTINIKSEEIAHYSSAAILLKNNSLLTTTPYEESHYSNLITLYTENVFNSWQTSSKISKDSYNRKAYIRVLDNIRYTLLTQEENFESSISVFNVSEENIAEDNTDATE